MGRSYRVLYLEDEDVWVDILQKDLDRINRLPLNDEFGVTIELHRSQTPDGCLGAIKAGKPFDLILVDLNLGGDPPRYGTEILQVLKDVPNAPPRVVLTGQPWKLQVQQALRLGVFEYYKKDALLASGDEQAQVDSHKQNICRFLETFFDLPSRYDFASGEGLLRFGLKRQEAAKLQQTLVGNDLQMWRVKAQIAAAARSELPVLITGESGTGKELAAEMIHRLSDRGRKNNDWVAINCAAFSSEVLMSELFGHVKGAFTGAQADKKGLLEEANKSTLFLDEVGHADYRFQASLLRAFSTGLARRIGSTDEYPLDVRLIAATDQHIFGSESFEPSFLNRLAGIVIKMPPLRARAGDIDKDLLITSCLNSLPQSAGTNISFSPAALMALQRYSWPGNVRELKHIVQAATLEAIRLSGPSSEVVVDAAQVAWLLQLAIGSTRADGDASREPFARYMADGASYKAVDQRFLAHYVHHMHGTLSGGERSNAAYEATAASLDCSPSTIKAKLADYDRLFGSGEMGASQ